jgi:dihydrofolate reductase
MTTIASISMSVDGFVTGPDDRPGQGLGAVSIGGGADLIRQSLAAGEVDELCLSIAPVVLGAGKPLFDGSLELDLEPLDVHQSRWATHVRYAVVR